jgi:hypothetical protein
VPHRTLSLRRASSALLALAGALLGGCQGAPPPEPARPTAVAQVRTPAPTPAPWRWGGGSDQQTALRLPNELLSIDLAVHPSESWPAVAATTWGGPTTNPHSALVRVFNPTTARWGPALQVDVGPSSLGRGRFGRVAHRSRSPRAATHRWRWRPRPTASSPRC